DSGILVKRPALLISANGIDWNVAESSGILYNRGALSLHQSGLPAFPVRLRKGKILNDGSGREFGAISRRQNGRLQAQQAGQPDLTKRHIESG
ncbi:MAG: hypothetical protein EB079_06365, partial [Verrucomicrobia bacterium]|nr:hypothetical protein [Verrucomicrobiota bacterium]